ncbi:MAG: O-methyltransferase [Acidimicrobiales bacterium]
MTRNAVQKLAEKVLDRGRVMKVEWVEQDPTSHLATLLPRSLVRLPAPPSHDLIREREEITSHVGAKPLWEGYGEDPQAVRTAEQVRTPPALGALYAALAKQLEPLTVVEFGTAFGASGMYWCAALEDNNSGTLYTFEPNEKWAAIARANLEAISDRFVLTVGTFEDRIADVLGDKLIDIAFIDAIHTSEFVLPQFDLVADRCHSKSIIILDDITFSPDMADCWARLSRDTRVAASVSFSGRAGLVELR